LVIKGINLAKREEAKTEPKNVGPSQEQLLSEIKELLKQK